MKHINSTSMPEFREAMQEALASWARLFENAGWGIAIGSANGETLQGTNPAFARMHGYPIHELIGRNLCELFAPDAGRELLDELRIADEKGSHVFESEQVRKDGSRFPALIDITTVKDWAGQVEYRAFHVQDISERKQQEAELRAASLPRDVLERLLEGCQVIDFDWKYLLVNDVLAKQSRRAAGELIGRTMMECYPGIDDTPMFSVLRRCMLERCHDRMENEFTFPDGTRICFELQFVPVPQGVCILSLDITERRNALSALVNDSDDAIIGRTLDGVVTSWNGAAERILGYSAAEMIGRPMAELYLPECSHEERAITERLVLGERIEHFETRRRQKSGQGIDLSITLSPIRDSAGRITGVSTIARDITAHKRMRAELLLAKESAEAANAELESFSYSVAHDLRAPLRSIDGFSQALLEDNAQQLDAGGQRYLGLVRESAQRMAQLIDDMLGLCRVTRSELLRVGVDVSTLARRTWARIPRGQPERQVELLIKPGLMAYTDAALLGLVFDNLLANAWKFTGRTEKGRVQVGSELQQGRRAFFVRDNGAGFDMAYASKLFGTFQRLHSESEFPGTGIGLAIVQRVVARHGGRVWAEGHVGAGACFWFTLD
jgi:PAS domain S-box-containing protein